TQRPESMATCVADAARCLRGNEERLLFGQPLLFNPTRCDSDFRRARHGGAHAQVLGMPFDQLSDIARPNPRYSARSTSRTRASPSSKSVRRPGIGLRACIVRGRALDESNEPGSRARFRKSGFLSKAQAGAIIGARRYVAEH